MFADAGRSSAARRAFGILLLASLMANVALLATAPERTSPGGASARARPPGHDGRAVLLPLPGAHGDRGSLGGLACEAAIVKLEQQRSALLTEVERNQPLEQRFSRGAPNPEAAAELRTIVDRALGNGTGHAPPDVTCRGAVCDLAFSGEPPGEGWQRTLYRTVEFAARVGEEAEIGPKTMRVPLRDPSGGESKAALVRLVQAFRQGPSREACWTQHGVRGRLDLVVWIGRPENEEPPPATEELSNGISFTVDGPLVESAAGTCLVERFQEEAARVAVPAHRAHARVPTFFVLPPDQPR